MKEIKEVWKTAVYIFESGDIIEFQGYAVSDQGRVKSLKRGKDKILKQFVFKNNDGTIWYRVCLRKNNKKYVLPVHRIVMSSFDADNWKPGRVVNHKTERTENSCINEFSNLEWTTQKANTNTEHRRTLQSKAHTNHPRKSKSVKVIFSDGTQQVFPSFSEVERALDLPRSTVSIYINTYNGFYKKGNLHFSYI